MFERDLDDLVAREIGPNGRVLAALPDDVGFVGLCEEVSYGAGMTRLGSSYSAGACSGGPHSFGHQHADIPTAAQTVPEHSDSVKRQLVRLPNRSQPSSPPGHLLGPQRPSRIGLLSHRSEDLLGPCVSHHRHDSLISDT